MKEKIYIVDDINNIVDVTDDEEYATFLMSQGFRVHSTNPEEVDSYIEDFESSIYECLA